MPIAQWGFQYEPFSEISNLQFNFKLISGFKVTNLTNIKSEIVHNNLLPKTNVPIASFMKTLEEINNGHSKSFSLSGY